MSRAPGTTKRVDPWSIGLLVLALASGLPLLVVKWLPFTDLPEHVAAIATLARMLPGGGGAPEYVLSPGESQYLLYHLTGAVLTRVIGDAALANRVLLFGVAVAWPYAVRALLRALGRDERVALFSVTLFWNRALVIGFLPFVASVPLALWALALLLEHCAAPTRRRATTLAVVAILLFYTHVSSYVLFAFAGGVMTLVKVGRDWRRILWVLVPSLPSGIAALAWVSAGSLASGRGATATTKRLPMLYALDAAPIWAFDVWRSHVDEIMSGIWWVAFAMILIAGLREKPNAEQMKSSAFGFVPFVCALLVYVLTPFKVGAAFYLDVRLAPLLALFMLPLLRPPAGRRGDRHLLLASLAGLGTIANACFEMLTTERALLGDASVLLAPMRPGTKVGALNFEARSPRTYFVPYVFVASYHRMKPGAIASWSFTEMAHWPLHYAPGAAPPVHDSMWAYRPCDFRYRSDGSYYDYLLVQGDRNPFLGVHPGPEFTAIARAGRFTLFEKTGAEQSESARLPDRGPCSRPTTSAEIY